MNAAGNGVWVRPSALEQRYNAIPKAHFKLVRVDAMGAQVPMDDAHFYGRLKRPKMSEEEKAMYAMCFEVASRTVPEKVAAMVAKRLSLEEFEFELRCIARSCDDLHGKSFVIEATAEQNKRGLRVTRLKRKKSPEAG